MARGGGTGGEGIEGTKSVAMSEDVKSNIRASIGRAYNTVSAMHRSWRPVRAFELLVTSSRVTRTIILAKTAM